MWDVKSCFGKKRAESFILLRHKIPAMSNHNNIKTEVKNDVLWATISRPQALNALNIDTIKELTQLIQEAKDNSIKGIVLTGEGEKAFVAGADIKEFSSLSKEADLALSQKGQRLFK